MLQKLTLSEFQSNYSDDDVCLEEIKKIKYPDGIMCEICRKVTPHYKITGRMAYSCKQCRNQTYPLVGTMFQKTSTPLSLWLYGMFLMIHTRSHISISQLQIELGVTYKTAWRMYHRIHALMEQNNGDLLTKSSMIVQTTEKKPGTHKVRKWILFNTFEIKVVHRQEGQEP